LTISYGFLKIKLRSLRLLSFALPLFILSCSEHLHTTALNLVSAYNRASIHAFKTSDFSLLENVTGDKELRVIKVLVESKQYGGVVLESTLENLELVSVKESGKTGMIVDTKERWRYFDRPLSPKRPPGPVFTGEMTMRYDCSNTSGKWKVMKVTTITNKTEKTNNGK